MEKIQLFNVFHHPSIDDLQLDCAQDIRACLVYVHTDTDIQWETFQTISDGIERQDYLPN